MTNLITVRKPIVKLGGSRCVILPSEWLAHHERDHGEITEVDIELGDALVVRPVQRGDGNKP